VFIDRDGTIADEAGYLNHISRFRMFPFAASAIRKLNRARIPVIVVTNQSGVARSYFPEHLVNEVHELLKRQLADESAVLTGVTIVRIARKTVANVGSPSQACSNARHGNTTWICASRS
jgi:D-glycero-D-manno-heptose 1,7-bisphosphate phosphatase